MLAGTQSKDKASNTQSDLQESQLELCLVQLSPRLFCQAQPKAQTKASAFAEILTLINTEGRVIILLHRRIAFSVQRNIEGTQDQSVNSRFVVVVQ